ncbi:hypothetical protein AKJ36_00305 [candidate division MSBL1 archaeon SCGC-AAA259I07]|uniref:NIF system FeS cluster assembly NifU C-terminal domain-containing protein n=2 Tax=candidate division MSBL1 TaxID=215777 RepID=A0A133U924_9EURY|nr:hypothetical protein AKJ61_00090 [candidate division MSBL1 archaeon SCGC-AAA259B11]KXA95521.1 hypothetical protein AKJ36_00305 [candidate division MSBL1 archaeon SCGC-AAA259I07]
MDREKVKRAIEEIRPQLRSEGVEIELIKVDENGEITIALVEPCYTLDNRLSGCGFGPDDLSPCFCCSGLSDGILTVIEEMLREKVPEIRGVKSIR